MEKGLEKTEKIEELDRITVSSGLIGKLLGVSDSRIRQLARVSMTVIKCKKTAIKFCSFMASGK